MKILRSTLTRLENRTSEHTQQNTYAVPELQGLSNLHATAKVNEFHDSSIQTDFGKYELTNFL